MSTSKRMLDAVERWAEPEYWLMRETAAAVNGRLDGLLVPRSFEASILATRRGYWTDKLGLTGIEVKTTRSDFGRGLKEGQFTRYLSGNLNGLFLVTDLAVKTCEVPESVGHLVVPEPWKMDERAICKRLPTWNASPLDSDTAWRIIFYVVNRARDDRNAWRAEEKERWAEIGERFAKALATLVDEKHAPEPK